MDSHTLDVIAPSDSTVAILEKGAKVLAPFIERAVNPGAVARDRAYEVIPREVFKQAATLGLTNFLLPSSVGGVNGSRRAFGLLLEQVGYYSSDPSLGTLVSMFSDVPNLIFRTGHDGLIERFVRPMARGDKLGTFAYTDVGDAFDFQATCTRTATGYVLNGVKVLQTGGSIADVFITYVSDGARGMKVFLLERDQPGVSLSQVHTIGLRSAGLTQLRMEQVEVDESRCLNTIDGLSDAQIFLNSRRIFLVAPLVGVMRQVVEQCTRHLKTVIREGRPLTQAQNVLYHLGGMSAKCQASRTLLHDALDRMETASLNEVFDETISVAKLMITEHGLDVCERAIRLTGWRGYSDRLPFERLYRGAMAALTGQTAQDVLQIQLGVLTVGRADMYVYGEKR